MNEDPNALPPSSGNVESNPANTDEALKAAQGHLVVIKELLENSRNAVVTTNESQKQAATALSDIQGKFAEITAVLTQMQAVKTQATDAQAVIVKKSEHIQNAQEHADKVRADLDRALTSATQQATEAEGQKSRTQSAADNAAKLLSDVRTVKGTVEADANAITNARKVAESSAEHSKNLADKATTVEERIGQYEKKLAELEGQCNAQLKTITDLLPGATGAGLAHAFNERRKAFLRPHGWWQVLFIISILAIVALAVTGLVHVYHSGVTPTYDELVRLWLARLPIAAALIWLALHASRESALAKRLEEDYGFKAAIAACFEGFKKQMEETGKDVNPNSALAKLLENTLATIAAPPGRIYDKHKLIVTPSDEIKQAAKAAVDVAAAAKIKP